MPSLLEGLGLALLEGMSGRLPVIASNGPAMLPLVEGAGGLSHEPGNVEQLTTALDTYLAMSDEQLRAKGEQVFRYLEENHALAEFQQKYLNLIETGLKEVGRA